ncbi:17.6 kDa class I heat shock protein 2-like [Prosopis cineraria]|uniref:17.6 kDa class I heat shock protein 2-like n=1 Tax=Prosopis cineraria TaxID=364024 RepID=UPI0024101FB8|nr:17.6 kDa class I heat shock protein 2-like [Prosopis cineraria]
MSSKAMRESVYEDLEPTINWIHGEQSDTLVFLLSGFSKEEMKVQITSNHVLKVSGEQQVAEDKGSVLRRFHKEFSVPRDIDINQIGAKFEDGKLYIKLPKAMTKAQKVSSGDLLAKHKNLLGRSLIAFMVAFLLLVLVIIGIRVRNNNDYHHVLEDLISKTCSWMWN